MRKRGWPTCFRHAALLMLVALPSIAAVGHRAGAQMLLYEDRLPDGFAYVRFANATSSSLILKPVGFADPLKLGASGADRVSAYYVVEKVANRKLSVRLDPIGQIDFELKPGAFQTVLITKSGGGIDGKVVTDQMELSQTKARLSFYNGISSCPDAALYLEPKRQAIFENVGPNLMRGRAVNPVPNPKVQASCGPGQLASLELGPLDAGGQYSVWLIDPSGTPTAFVSKNKIAPYLR